MNTQKIKVGLESELSAVVSELKTIAVHTPTTDDWEAVPDCVEQESSDDNVVADAAEESESRQAVLAQLETRYRNITRALHKLEAGTYGLCEISGKPIEPERLAAYPVARTNLENIERERELPL